MVRFTDAKLFVYAIISLLILTPKASGQTADTNHYYVTYRDKLTVRLYLAQKFAPFTIYSYNDKDLDYKTNTKLDLGAGFTYHYVTLNLSYGFSFLNKENGKGETKGLNLQLHVYPRKWAVDVLAGFIQGYYLQPDSDDGIGITGYYQRPDIHRNIFGASVYRVNNPGKFSYKAALNQTEWQTHSAGSILYGAEMFYGSIHADSAFVPSKGADVYKQAGINRINFFSFGPGVGYAYTLVIDKHFFVAGSLAGSINFNTSAEYDGDTRHVKCTVLPGCIYKAGIGYNSYVWSVATTLRGNALFAASKVSDNKYFLPTGSLNFIVGRKLNVGRRKPMAANPD